MEGNNNNNNHKSNNFFESGFKSVKDFMNKKFKKKEGDNILDDIDEMNVDGFFKNFNNGS